jgi:hypothetical protein
MERISRSIYPVLIKTRVQDTQRIFLMSLLTEHASRVAQCRALSDHLFVIQV